MADFKAQSTDAENSKALRGSTAVDDDVKSRGLGSLQAIARGVRPSKGEAKIAGSGGKNPGANVQAGK